MNERVQRSAKSNSFRLSMATKFVAVFALLVATFGRPDSAAANDAISLSSYSATAQIIDQIKLKQSQFTIPGTSASYKLKGVMMSTQLYVDAGGRPWIGMAVSKSGYVGKGAASTEIVNWVNRKESGLIIPKEIWKADGLDEVPRIRALHIPDDTAPFIAHLEATLEQHGLRFANDEIISSCGPSPTRRCAELASAMSLHSQGLTQENLRKKILAFETTSMSAELHGLDLQEKAALRAYLHEHLPDAQIKHLETYQRKFCPGCSKMDQVGHGLPRLRRCFTAGTKVATLDGDRPIETLAPGDRVWGIDESSLEISPQEVVQTFANPPAPTLRVTVAFQGAADDTIDSTFDHPYLTSTRGWVAASELAEGETLLTREGRFGSVKSTEATGRVEPVFNVEVANTHSYFVGVQHVAVHNDSNPAIVAFPESYLVHDGLVLRAMGEDGSDEAPGAPGSIHEIAAIPAALGTGPRAHLMRLAYIGMFANREIGRAAVAQRQRGPMFDICGQGKDFIDQACMHLNDLRNPFSAVRPKDLGTNLLFDLAVWGGETLANKLDEHLVKQNDLARRREITAGLEPLRPILGRNGLGLQK